MKSSPALAIKYFKRAIGLQPHSHTAHLQLAWLLYHSEKTEESYEHFLQSCIHSKGKSMADFQRAGTSLRYKKSPSVAKKWRRGTAVCFESLKEEKASLKSSE